MLDALKRLFSGPAAPAEADFSAVAQWAQRRGHGFKRARDGEGFVVDGRLEGTPWRLEWGPPQRAYISGHELRLRIETELSADLQMLLLSRALMDSLERQTYEEFTESTQTQIGTTTPEEMRWLVMFPKVNLGAFPALRPHFGVVASSVPTGLAWLEGPLAHTLERARATLLKDEPPFLLMTMRHRVYLRLQLAEPDAGAIAMALELFETAVSQATRSASGHVDTQAAWASTASTAWQSLRPEPSSERRAAERKPPKRS